jgi:hypothetical protein
VSTLASYYSYLPVSKSSGVAIDTIGRWANAATYIIIPRLADVSCAFRKLESGIDAMLALLHLELHTSVLGNWIEQHIQPTGKRNAILIGQGVVEIIS